MNVIQVKDSALYTSDGGHYSVQGAGHETHIAYMVLGRAGSQALVVEGTAATEMAAIEHLMRQVRLLRDWMDIACHGAFWSTMEAEAEKRLNDLRAQMGLPMASKKDDDSGLS